MVKPRFDNWNKSTYPHAKPSNKYCAQKEAVRLFGQAIGPIQKILKAQNR